MSFTKATVLVTGASSGVGAATSIAFAKEGANVVMVGRNIEKLKDVSQKCEQVSPCNNKPFVIVADITKDDEIERIMTETITTFGQLNVLVNNAGIARPVNIGSETAIKVFDEVFNVNLRAAIYLTNLSVQHLIESKGNIVNVSSIGAIIPFSQSWAHGPAKAGLDQFTKCVAFDLAKKGVRANSINLGPVKTDIVNNIGMNNEKADFLWELMRKGTALKRISEPEEVAELILFLASDKAKSITGSSYVMDNGMTLKGGF